MAKPIRRVKEAIIRGALLLCAYVGVLTTVAIVVVLLRESIEFFAAVAPWKFLFGTRWSPIIAPYAYGVLPLVCGTLLITVGALLLAVPVGLATALYLSEYAPRFVRSILKPILEILAGIPTVVFGYFAVTFVTPFLLQPLFPSTEVFNAASAAIVVGLMVIPTICSLCDDAFQAVPRSLREAGHAMAATRFEVSTRVVFPAAMSGVVAAILLAMSRAIGETMAVALAAGMNPKITLNPLLSVQTMTSYIVQVSEGDTPPGTMNYQSIFAIGLALFAITLAINLLARVFVRRYRETYE